MSYISDSIIRSTSNISTLKLRERYSINAVHKEIREVGTEVSSFLPI